MLIDADLQPLHPTMALMLGSIAEGSPDPKPIRTGCYEIGHFNFGSFLSGTLNSPIGGPWDEHPELGEHSAYGVCDSVEQFFETPLGQLVRDDTRKFVVSFVRITRASQPPEGGWRWHKWGPYIGKHQPEHEYLYDEEGIDEVFAYHVFEHVDGKKTKGPVAWG